MQLTFDLAQTVLLLYSTIVLQQRALVFVEGVLFAQLTLHWVE